MIFIPQSANYPNRDRIRVLVVDDSAFMRSAIKGMLSHDPELEVVATARDGQDAIDKIEKFKPDIVTMDIEMPRMDGLTALKIIMETMPLPVLILSSLSEEGAETTLQAMDLGAVDFICKDLQARSMNIMNVEEELIHKIKSIVAAKGRRRGPILPAAVSAPVQNRAIQGHAQNIAIVAIGVSTGGPRALQDVIPYLPKDFLVPVLIVQHMPRAFTKPFAERMNAISQLEVKEAETGDIIEPGKVFIARGGIHMKVRKSGLFEAQIELDPHPEDILYHPSVDIMMHSVVEVYRGRTLGVIMTGMGNDGTEGLRAIKQAGGKTLAQDEESCVVYGMPRSVAEAGLADKVAPLKFLANEIVNMV